MNFYEIQEPYYALIKAESKEVAKDEYVANVADDDEGNLIEHIEEVDRDYAIVLYSRTLSEEGTEIPIEEVLNDIKNDRNMVLIVDGDLC